MAKRPGSSGLLRAQIRPDPLTDVSVTDNELSFISPICFPEGPHSNLTLLHRAGGNSESSTGVNAQDKNHVASSALTGGSSAESCSGRNSINIPRGQILCKDALRNDNNTIHKVIICLLQLHPFIC